jgi:ribosomal protein S18 acetylase RimI-like enzyme
MEIIQTFDSEVVAHLNKDIQNLHHSMYPERFKQFEFLPINDFFKRMMENPNFYFFIIKDNGQNLGYTWIEIKEYQESAFLNSYRSIIIHQISIVLEHQNKGLGQQLMIKINEFAIERNINRIELDYWSNNKNAKKFYQKNGFNTYREFVFKDLE